MPNQLYRLVVDGELGPRYASAFEGMRICAKGGKTEITGVVVDRSQLQGLLDRINGLGLTLDSVNRLGGGGIEARHTLPPPVTDVRPMEDRADV